ncbi:DivIVA domain-containing protein [Oryzobacter terrae]|uniref:DivIVA domain-containing protein n=1 Tax=Oryzobacter terrae TaxID=1620385 RepID=UPI00366C823F
MARVLRADDVEHATFTRTQLRAGYDEGEVDDLLRDVAATLRRHESGTSSSGFRMESTGLASVRFTSTRLRPGYDHAEVDAFLADVVHTLEHHEAHRAALAQAASAAEAASPEDGPAGAAETPPVAERESWRARVMRTLRGEDG